MTRPGAKEMTATERITTRRLSRGAAVTGVHGAAPQRRVDRDKKWAKTDVLVEIGKGSARIWPSLNGLAEDEAEFGGTSQEEPIRLARPVFRWVMGMGIRSEGPPSPALVATGGDPMVAFGDDDVVSGLCH